MTISDDYRHQLDENRTGFSASVDCSVLWLDKSGRTKLIVEKGAVNGKTPLDLVKDAIDAPGLTDCDRGGRAVAASQSLLTLAQKPLTRATVSNLAYRLADSDTCHPYITNAVTAAYPDGRHGLDDTRLTLPARYHAKQVDIVRPDCEAVAAALKGDRSRLEVLLESNPPQPARSR